MPTSRARMFTLALVVLTATGCSAPASGGATVYDQARDLGQDVSQAVAATQSAVTGSGRSEFAAEAIERAASASRQLAATTSRLQAPELRAAAIEMVSIADDIVARLTAGQVSQAEDLRANQLVPVASRIAELRRVLPDSVATPAAADVSGGTNLPIAATLTILVVTGLVVLLLKGSTRESDPARTPTENRKQFRRENPERNWNAPHPLYEPAAPAEPANGEGDTTRTTRIRPIDVELQSLLTSTVEQALERDWEVTVVCPEVHISGDPIRIQRAILAALGNAYLGEPERVGIVVENEEGHVKLSLGHDAPFDETTTEDLAVRLTNQLGYALGVPDLEWSVAYEGEISLITVELGAGLVTGNEARSAAESVGS